jgi:hypothetical protein
MAMVGAFRGMSLSLGRDGNVVLARRPRSTPLFAIRISQFDADVLGAIAAGRAQADVGVPDAEGARPVRVYGADGGVLFDERVDVKISS